MSHYAASVGGETYRFADLKQVLACASPRRSGDELAGLAASSDAQRVAARFALADLPLKTFLSQALIPYEDDEVTRLIVNGHDAGAFAPVSPSDGWRFPGLAAVLRGRYEGAAGAGAGLDAGNGRRRVQAHAQPGFDRGRAQMHRGEGLPQHGRAAGAALHPAAAEPPDG